MWEITNPEIRKTKLDFTSSGQGFREVSQLVAEKIVLMNALELTDFDDEKTQFLICEQCGTIHCEAGNWGILRKSGELVLMIPAFEEIENAAEGFSETEYAPPLYFKEKGIPFFRLEIYENLQTLQAAFPPVENIKPLQMREAVRLVQMSFPMRVFGTPPEIKLDAEKTKNIVAASNGESEQILQKLEAVLRRDYENRSPAILRPPASGDEVVSLFVDEFEFADWRALVRSNNETHLILDGRFIVTEQA